MDFHILLSILTVAFIAIKLVLDSVDGKDILNAENFFSAPNREQADNTKRE